MNRWRGILEEFKGVLPLTADTPRLSLNEGGTPLVEAQNITEEISFRGELYFKIEGANPTGSFKDRGMVVAVAKALEKGAEAIICASTGNTAASAAAYAARAGIRAIVLLPEGNVAQGKLAQSYLHEAQVVQIDGNFDDAQRIVKEIADNYPVTTVNSLNPYRLEGQKTASFEIAEQLDYRFPDFHFIPVGNGGNITAYWKGYQEYQERAAGERSIFSEALATLPRMMGYQAEGAAPIVTGHIVENPETIASAIRIGNPARWHEVKDAIEESSGKIDSVTDEEILSAYQLLASTEGIFCEPAAAASVAGFLKAHGAGLVPAGSVVVCTLTGNGLKDPDTAISVVEGALKAPANTQDVVSVLGLSKK